MCFHWATAFVIYCYFLLFVFFSVKLLRRYRCRVCGTLLVWHVPHLLLPDWSSRPDVSLEEDRGGLRDKKNQISNHLNIVLIIVLSVSCGLTIFTVYLHINQQIHGQYSACFHVTYILCKTHFFGSSRCRCEVCWMLLLLPAPSTGSWSWTPTKQPTKGKQISINHCSASQVDYLSIR